MGASTGTVTNASTVTLLKPTVVLGGTVANLKDLAAGAVATVDVAVAPNPMGQSLSDKVVGPLFFGDTGRLTADMTDLYIRHAIVDQLTLRSQLGTDRVAHDRRGRHPRLGLGQPAAGRHRRPEGAGHRQRPVLPAGRHRGQRQDHVPRRPAALEHDRRDGRVLQQGSVQHQLREGQRDHRLSADLVQRHVRTDRARDGHELRRRHAGRPSPSRRSNPCPRSRSRARIRRPRTAPWQASMACPRSSCSTWSAASGFACRTCPAAPGTRSPSRRATSTPPSGSVVVRFVNDRSDGVGFSFDLSMTGNVR